MAMKLVSGQGTNIGPSPQKAHTWGTVLARRPAALECETGKHCTIAPALRICHPRSPPRWHYLSMSCPTLFTSSLRGGD
eukprot:1933557-Amphidinium_carterae.1